ncbi:uncharacterized protein [Nicotiana tomentosiformis]|uniref:uncharacterized protein n=1 Tax=Nicotiana tomentosiformis TaxID=4098 RepID=UPI00388C936E
MLQLNGRWDSFGRYIDFDISRIVINEDSNYSQLNTAIAEHLMIDTSVKIIEIKYTVNERYPPMKIRNDMGVRVYMEMKKENKNLGMYLLCITVSDFDLECSMSNASTIAGSMLPLAYAIVDSENYTSWRWFFEQFKHAHGEKSNMCVVSNRNESILKATSTVYTGMPYYACMWHIWKNIRSKFKNEIDMRVKAYLYNIGYHKWSLVHATANRTWTMTSNIVESLNAVTKDARELPVVQLLEYMRTLLERWTNEKLLNTKSTFTYLGKKYNKELEDNRTLSQKMRRYSCGQFHLDKLPFSHALAALRHRNESYENYCSPYYTRESLLQTYEIPVDPLPDESKWDVPQHIAEEVVLPPTGKRQSRRPQKQRYKPNDEINAKRYKVSCGNCGQEGHNKRSYRNAPKRK